MTRKKKSPKFKSANIIVRRSLSEDDGDLARMVATFEFRIRWGPTITAWLCILLGFAFSLISRNPETGDYVITFAKALSFKGAFGGVLVVTGALIVWLSRPNVRLVFEGDDTADIRAAPREE